MLTLIVRLAESWETGVRLVSGVETWRGILLCTVAKGRACTTDLEGLVTCFKKRAVVGLWQNRASIAIEYQVR